MYLPIKLDAIIYLRTTPEIAFERVKKRNRPEEVEISLEYITLLHTLYEKWIPSITSINILTLDATQSLSHIMLELNET